MNNKPITLTNLTSYQVEMLDHMWSIESMEEVEEWQATLSASDRVMSNTLMRLVVHEIVEELVVEDLSLANEYLSKFRL
jgi:hypothetical protein